MAVEVRPAAAEDVAAIEEIGGKTWPATYSFAGDDYIAHGLATWWSSKALLQSLDDTTVLVAVDSGQVVGTGNIDVRRAVPVIWKLYVLRGQGIHRAAAGVSAAPWVAGHGMG